MNRIVALATLVTAAAALSGCVAEEGYYDQGGSYGYRGAPYAYPGPSYAPPSYWAPSYRGDGYRGDGYRGDGYRGDGYRGEGRRGQAYREPPQFRGNERGNTSRDPGAIFRAPPPVARSAPPAPRGVPGQGGREQPRVEQGAD